MSGPEDSRRDPLSDTLSTRSYLVEGLQPQHQQPQLSSEINTPDSLPTEKIEDPSGKSGLCSAQSNSEKTAKTVVGRPRKRGRPRLETTKDADAIEERRLQIRRAQRTYRQKKEATIQALKTRVEVLEQTLQNVSNLMGPEAEIEPRSSLAVEGSSAFARTRRLVLAEIERARLSDDDDDEHDHGHGHQNGDAPRLNTLRDIFGYHVSHAKTEDYSIKNNPQEQAYPHPRSPSPLINRLFPTTTIYTYSYQESDLSRRLQRFCLEHTYRWLSDPHSNPTLISRVFGLIPCIHDMPGIRRNYRRVLQAEIGGPLEVDKLPFYKLGGAGTHYPRIGVDGEPIYPEKLRRPGKILRRMTRILQRGGIQDWDEDWSGHVEPRMGEEDGMAMSDMDRLRALDLDGEWFDCHDVQGYLEDRGVILDGSSMWMEVPASTVGLLYGFPPDHSASQYYVSPGEASSSDMSGTQYLGSSHYVLDLESFFDLLLANLRILGRAPGFRLGDIDAALRTTIHRRPLN